MEDTMALAEAVERLSSENGKLKFFMDEVFRVLDPESKEYKDLYELAVNLKFNPNVQ